MKEHKKIIVDISRNNKGEISCGLQIDAVLAKNELYAGIQSIAVGSMMSGLIPPEIDDCIIQAENRFMKEQYGEIDRMYSFNFYKDIIRIRNIFDKDGLLSEKSISNDELEKDFLNLFMYITAILKKEIEVDEYVLQSAFENAEKIYPDPLSVTKR
ncbi:hypothetical protein [Enterococcus cecorum]|uniref:hypothetical protein n=1 Tax=Enterococcus cecorum TaxID=44008 RepID=UPI000643B541|nr:hypothetical protein [Enterococcus cecorum]KLO73821.1 hypothetical protein AA989_06070 [Enterococcus cecorum]